MPSLIRILLLGSLLSTAASASGLGTLERASGEIPSWEEGWLRRYRSEETERLPEYALVHDYFGASLAIKLGTNPYPGTPREITHPHFARPLKILAAGQSRNRETILLLMGLHEDSTKPYYRYIARTLLQNGYNVVALPNPLSDDYRAAQPRLDCPPGKISCEAQIAQEILSGVLKLPAFANGSNKIHLLGFSYGSMMGAYLRRAAPGLITGKTLFLSPIFDFSTTISRLDSAFERDLNPFPEEALGLSDVLKLERDAHLPWIDSEEIEARAARITSFTFHDKLRQTLNDVRERGQCSRDRVEHVAEHPESRLRLSSLLEACAEDMDGEHSSGNLTLENLWVDASSADDITLLAATDDTFNDRGAAEAFQEKFSGRARVLILPFGGHTGFVYSDWMARFLGEVFRH